MVTATDISAEPLAIGETRALERNLSNIRFRVADVHALPFPVKSFDRVTSRLGVMFFADPARALAEVYRVLDDKGRVSLLAWGPMEQPYFDATVGTVLRTLPDLRIPPAAAAMFKFAASGTLSRQLREAGFKHVDERAASVDWNWPGSPEDLWDYFQDVTAPFKPLLQSIPDGRRDEVRKAVLQALQQRYKDNAVRLQAQIVLASASK